MRLSSRVLVPALLVLFAGCSGDTMAALIPDRLPDGPVTVTRLRGEPYSLTYYSGFGSSMRTVARGEDEWRGTWKAIWGSLTPLPQLPRIDFGRQMVAVAALGSRPTGGFGILIDSARSSSGRLDVFVRTIMPGPKCVVTAAFSAPLDAALLPQTSEPVRFVDVPTILNC